MKTKSKKHSKNDDLIDDNFDDPEIETKKWYQELADTPKEFEPVTEQILIELKNEAEQCYKCELANFNIKNSKTNSNYQWMKTVMSKGTVSDKVAAYTVTIQDNPVYNLETIQNLVSMVKVGKKKECIIVMDVLTDLFVSDLLRPDCKLKAFSQQPLSLLNDLTSGNAITRRKYLSFWYFEDELKQCFMNFVQSLNNIAHDTVESNKEKAIASMYKLLANNPEQEKALLSNLVNKLGDPSQKIASKIIYSLTQLLLKHPNMQIVVLNEVEKLLFRPNVSTKAQYYGLCYLTQFYLNDDSPEVARRLIELYFSFFKACVKKGDIDSRMMTALLMGVNRAYPYAKLEMEKMTEHVDTIYKIVHLANFNIGIQALRLLLQISDSNNNITDRYYSALYRKLGDSKLFTTTYQAMLLNLIYKSLLKDTEIVRIKCFIKRLLQATLYMQPSFACGILYLISQLLSKHNDLQSLILKQSSLNTNDDDDDDGEEKYKDVKDEDDIKEKINDDDIKEEINDDEIKPDVDELNKNLTGWYHRQTTKKGLPQKYQPLNRNPLYCGAEHTAYLELLLLKEHHHPTVALYANNILEGVPIKYSGDPLKDFTLIRFLDRFVFKNPKKPDTTLKPGVNTVLAKRKFYRPRGLKALPVTSENYLNESRVKIPVDELFMYTFLQKKWSEQKLRKTDGDDDDSDLESVKSDEFEEMLDKITGSKIKVDEDLDFMTDIGDSLKKKKQSKKSKDGDDNDDNIDGLDDEEVDDNDLNVDIGDDEDFNDDDDLLDDLDDDDDVLEFGSDDETTKKKSKKINKGDINSLFASAEEFAELLEDEGSSKIAPGSSNAFINTDKADAKQLAWEEQRNRWLKGYNKNMGGKGGKDSKRKKPHQTKANKKRKIK